VVSRQFAKLKKITQEADMYRVIWQKTNTGCHEVLVTLPTHWQGEVNCVVGPFSSREVAHYFANNVVDFGHFEDLVMRVFPNADAWYLEVTSAEREAINYTQPHSQDNSAARGLLELA
jgi:hypothetical protein